VVWLADDGSAICAARGRKGSESLRGAQPPRGPRRARAGGSGPDAAA